MQIEKKKHVSFSEVKLYSECSYRHHIEYTLGIKQPETVHLIFGTAVHEAIENFIVNKTNKTLSMCKKIYKWIKQNPKDKYLGDLDAKQWCSQALLIYKDIFSWLQDEFPGHEVVGSEVSLYEPIKLIVEASGRLSDDVCFKGFIDMVIKDKDGIYHIIDFKTTSWGWDKEKRSDTEKQYQLTLYKKFYCEKNNIDPKYVKTHFVLLKRTPAKNSKRAELITITSGNKKIDNAKLWLEKNTKLINSGIKLKNRTACKHCPWFGTKNCT